MQWHSKQSGKRGCGTTFNDVAIQFRLSIKWLFNLRLRQAMGITQSLLQAANRCRASYDELAAGRRRTVSATHLSCERCSIRSLLKDVLRASVATTTRRTAMRRSLCALRMPSYRPATMPSYGRQTAMVPRHLTNPVGDQAGGQSNLEAMDRLSSAQPCRNQDAVLQAAG